MLQLKIHKQGEAGISLFLTPTNVLTQRGGFVVLARRACYRTSRLAKLAGMSVRTLERHFEQKCGHTPRECLDALRFQAARTLLSDGKSVKEVAVEVGYTDSSHFSAAFKKHFGCGPREFVASSKPAESVSLWLD